MNDHYANINSPEVCVIAGGVLVFVIFSVVLIDEIRLARKKRRARKAAEAFKKELKKRIDEGRGMLHILDHDAEGIVAQWSGSNTARQLHGLPPHQSSENDDAIFTAVTEAGKHDFT